MTYLGRLDRGQCCEVLGRLPLGEIGFCIHLLEGANLSYRLGRKLKRPFSAREFWPLIGFGAYLSTAFPFPFSGFSCAAEVRREIVNDPHFGGQGNRFQPLPNLRVLCREPRGKKTSSDLRISMRCFMKVFCEKPANHFQTLDARFDSSGHVSAVLRISNQTKLTWQLNLANLCKKEFQSMAKTRSTSP